MVDAHHHVWDLTVRDQPWISGPTLEPLRRSFPLARLPRRAVRTVVVQTVSDESETRELLRLGPPVAAVVGWVDLTAPDVGARLAALLDGPGGHRLAGVRHQVQDETDPEWLCRPDVRRGLRAVSDAGLVFDLLVTPAQLPAAIATVRALPEARFVLDHLGKPRIAEGADAQWSSLVGALAESENVDAKLSGLVTEADLGSWTVQDLRPFVEHALTVFGPRRLMFGSDWPVCTLAASYDEVLAAAGTLTEGLTATERTSVFHSTATRVYRLDTPTHI
ncbi:amidohydrolase family protein [Pseudonocardia spinosispora]|uniref:amidohydrolase family protein n=1 Tax=Pseudonocardia spinosispora TaxID=103441 RepID=UPI001B7F7B0C|nr:amidohydrolase family protein [Pseudonocardia spinosispora]